MQQAWKLIYKSLVNREQTRYHPQLLQTALFGARWNAYLYNTYKKATICLSAAHTSPAHHINCKCQRENDISSFFLFLVMSGSYLEGLMWAQGRLQLKSAASVRELPLKVFLLSHNMQAQVKNILKYPPRGYQPMPFGERRGGGIWTGERGKENKCKGK